MRPTPLPLMVKSPLLSVNVEKANMCLTQLLVPASHSAQAKEAAGYPDRSSLAAVVSPAPSRYVLDFLIFHAVGEGINC